ncbi:MAG: FAD-dependent monooxygenase [Candidatus Acidiferrales bacterium]|jgi:flavin-dependent dehydrogenase
MHRIDFMKTRPTHASSSSTDVLIVGGGPAGLAAAIGARQKGFEVIVADRERPSIDKSCGEGLMGDGVEALGALGVQIPAKDSFSFRGIRFIGSGSRVEAGFSSARGLGIRRTTLHRLLLDRATKLGVQFRWETRFTGIEAQGLSFGANFIRARWVVGADGQDSMIRRQSGLDSHYFNSRRLGFRRHYRIAPWTDMAEIYWSDGCQIYVTPVAAEEICVVVISKNQRLRLEQALPLFPELRARLQRAEILGAERGGVTRSRLLRRVARGNVALIGDASGSVDAVSGQGLCLSFRQALALTDALVASDLMHYHRAHRRLMAKPMVSSCALLLFAHYSWLRQRVFRILASDPGRFARLLSMHAGPGDIRESEHHGVGSLALQRLNGSE